jgi:hypothetical protein
MKTKISISVLLLFGVLFFSFKNYLADTDNFIKKNSEHTPTEEVRKISLDEQKEALNYFSRARSYKFECESTDSEGMFFYKTRESGTDITDLSEFGKGEKVRFCKSGFDKEGYIVKDLEYTEQVEWGNASFSDWRIKPRLRIDKEQARTNPNLKVCRIEIVNFEGKIIDSTDIFIQYFLDLSKDPNDGYYYKGEYIDRFRNSIEEWDISILSESFNPSNNKGKNCKVDYRVYWYGECDIWIDYIKVENIIAERLLKGEFDVILSGMDIMNVKEIINLENKESQRECINYLTDKINLFNKN